LRITTKPYKKTKTPSLAVLIFSKLNSYVVILLFKKIKKRPRSTFAYAISFLPLGYECNHIDFVFAKDKRTPFLKPNFSCFQWQISHYTVTKETCLDHFVSDKFCNESLEKDNYAFLEKDNCTPNCKHNHFCHKSKGVKTLLQWIGTCLESQ
jgi:hypothetical protein